MKAMQVREFGKPLELADVDTPTPKGSSVLIRVKAAGVCHTDLHLISGGYNVGEGRSFNFRDEIALVTAAGFLPALVSTTSHATPLCWICSV